MTLISKIGDSSGTVCGNNTELPAVYYNKTEQNEKNSHWLKPWREKELDSCQVLNNSKTILTPKRGQEKQDNQIKDQLLMNQICHEPVYCSPLPILLLFCQYSLASSALSVVLRGKCSHHPYKCRNPEPERVGIMPKVTEIIREGART